MVANRPPEPIAAFLELHIEQGERLAEHSIPIGVVEGIVGIRRYYVTFLGQTHHAGTTGMARRRDALVMAAPFSTAVREVAIRHAIVGTIGRLEVHPGAPNVIPGRVTLDLEMRSMDDDVLDTAARELAALAAANGGDFVHGNHKKPVPAALRLRHRRLGILVLRQMHPMDRRFIIIVIAAHRELARRDRHPLEPMQLQRSQRIS